MGYILLWLFLICGAWCWLAAGLAMGARVPRKFLRVVMRVILCLVPVGVICGIVWVATVARRAGWVHGWDTWMVWGLACVFVVGAAGMFWQRWWRCHDPVDGAKPMRWRTLGSLYLLGIFLSGLHLYTLYVLQSISAEAVTAELAPSRARVQAYLDRDALEQKQANAARDPAAPADGTAAYKAYDDESDPNQYARRRVLWWRMQELQERIQRHGEPAGACRIKMPKDGMTFTPEDDIEESLVETLSRFRAEIEVLRTCAQTHPLHGDQSLQRLDTMTADDPVMRLQGESYVFLMDGLGALEERHFARAVQDMKTIESISKQGFEIEHLIGCIIGLAIHEIGNTLGEAILNAPGLQTGDMGAWELAIEPECQEWFLRAMDFEEHFSIRAFQRIARDETGMMEGDPKLPTTGYFGALVRAYVPVCAARDVHRVSDQLRTLARQPYYQNLAVWQARSELGVYGFAGVEMEAMFKSALMQSVIQDVRTDLLGVARAAVAFRLETGNFPATLAELVPKYLGAVPCDRFTGRALYCRTEPGGLTIWSAGGNGKDDDGDDYSRMDVPAGADDVVVRLGAAYEKYRKSIRDAYAAGVVQGRN